MNFNDEELQKKIESGALNPGDADGLAYQKVFSALKKAPQMNLPPDFSEKVIQRLVDKKQSGFSSDFIWFGLAIIVLLAGFAYSLPIALEHVDLKSHFSFLSFLVNMKWYFVAAIVMIGIFNWLEKRLLSVQ